MAVVPVHLVSWKFVHHSVEYSCRLYVRVTKQVRCFVETLRLVETLNDEVANETLSAPRGVLGVINHDDTNLSSADVHDLLLTTTTAAAHTRCRKPNAIFSSRAFYSYATSLLGKQRSTYSKACDKCLGSFDGSLLTEVLRQLSSHCRRKK